MVKEKVCGFETKKICGFVGCTVRLVDLWDEKWGFWLCRMVWIVWLWQVDFLLLCLIAD